MKKENFSERLIDSLKQGLEHAKIKAAMDSALKNSRIESDNDYEKIEVVFDRLISLKNRNESEDKLFMKLADLMEDYEKRTLEGLPESSPREKLAFLMKENKLKKSDLLNIFSSEKVVSEVLSGKREMTKNEAKALADRFKLKIEAFI